MGEKYFGIKLLHSSVSFISEFVHDNDVMLDRRTGFRAELIEIKKTHTLPLLPYSSIKYLEEKKPVKNFTQEFIFKGLSARIESSLKEKLFPLFEIEKPKLCGIKLLSSSTDRLTAFEKVSEPIGRKTKRRKLDWKEIVSAKEAIEEAAVATDWILSGQACLGWKDPKRPRVSTLKLVHAASNGRLTCDHFAT